MKYIKSKNLDTYQHGFFSRIGGVSGSYFNSLNCGYSSSDDNKNIEKNRMLILNQFNLDIEKLVVPEQFHSNKIKVFKTNQKNYKCDGIINTVSGIALGVLTADCCPILIGHKKKKLTGVIHAGWKGIQSGIIEYHEAQWNTKKDTRELSRNTKKFAGIPRCIDKQIV